MLSYLLLSLIIIIFIVFVFDIFQKKHAIIRNFPIVGHFRYLIEMIGPELRQYIIANDKEEMPFNRRERSWIYSTAKQQQNTFGQQTFFTRIVFTLRAV